MEIRIAMRTKNKRFCFCKSLKMFCLIAGLAVMLGAVPAGAAPPLPLSDLMVKMQEAYDGTTDLKATFVQETLIKSVKMKQREEGIVYFKKPQQMVWDYKKPKVKKLVVTTTKAWFYVPQDNAVYVQDVNKVLKSQLAVRFLSGIGKLRDDFDIAYADGDKGVDQQGHYKLILKPRKADPGMDHLRMTVDGNTFQIQECRFSDNLGNDTRLQFRNIKINSGLPDRLFSFKPPPKADVFPMQ